MEPYGPVYHFMLLLYELYMVFTLCLYDFRWYMTFEIFEIFRKLILHIYFITFLEFVKDHFSSPHVPKFAVLCKFDFPKFLN